MNPSGPPNRKPRGGILLPTDIRGARVAEYPAIRSLLQSAFQTDDEARLWDHLVANDPDLQPDGVRVATHEGEVIACAVILPRQIRSRQGWVSGAIITLVACHPRFQRQGYGGEVVADAIEQMKRAGLALGILYGHPTYYPRFGFVPVLPAVRTNLRLPEEPVPAEQLRPASEADLPALATLFAEGLSTFPCAVARSAAPWLWQVRSPERIALLMLPDQAGYALLSTPAGSDQAFVHEAGAADRAALHRLLNSLLGEARARGRNQLRFSLPAQHPLTRLAPLSGAEQAYHPASAGMAVVTDWAPLLPPGYQVDATGLHRDGEPALPAGYPALVQLVLGYRSVDDLLLLPDGPTLPPGSDLERLRADFPPLSPKWSLAPFWH